MNISTFFEVDKSYFQNSPINAEFRGKMKEFRFAGKSEIYIIGICSTNSITKTLDDGTVIYGKIPFVLGKKKDITVKGVVDLIQKEAENELILTFKGFTKNGYPIFHHSFV